MSKLGKAEHGYLSQNGSRKPRSALLRHGKDQEASIITRTLVFQEMTLLVAGGEEQKEDRIRAEEERGPSPPQWMSLSPHSTR